MDSHHSLEMQIRQRTGTVLLLLGTIGAVLVYVDRSGTGDIDFPTFWYRTRSLHLFFCLAAFAAGAALLRNPRALPDDVPENEIVPVFQSVVMYSKPSCGLCDDAFDLLSRHSTRLPDITVVDISGDPQLEDEHGQCIPVVEVDGRIRFRGHVDETLLTRMIEAAERRQKRDVDPDPLAEPHG